MPSNSLTDLESVRRKLDRKASDLDHARKVVAEEKTALRQARTELADLTEALRIVQEVARGVQESAHAQISSVVSRCLQAVYGAEAPEFKILFEKKRNKTEARLVFVTDGNEVDPLRWDSGGKVQVAALALRLACLMLARPRRRRLFVLDEPFAGADSEARPRLAELLGSLAEELDLQIVLSTHWNDFEVGKVIRLGG